MRPVHASWLFLACWLCVPLGAQDASEAGQETKPPHIVFFITDDLGWQDTALSLHSEKAPFQEHYRTPNLQRLAREGLVFTNAYASSPVCTPTRTSIMTGRSPQANGITYWILRKDRDTGGPREGTVPPAWNVNGLQPGDVTLPALLQKGGYRTIHAGKAHLGAHGSEGADPRNLGFDVNIAGHAAGAPSDFRGRRNFARDPEKPGDRIWDVPGLEKYHGKDTYLTEALALEAATAITQAHQDGQRFFLHFSPYAVHTPIIANERHLDHYAELPKVEAAYATMIESVDEALGVLLTTLENLKILDETVIVFTSDNGGLSAHTREKPHHRHNHPLRSGKGSALEGGTRIPLVVRWPGTIQAGRRSDLPVISHDHFPTLLEVAGIAGPRAHMDRVEGWNLMPIFEDSGAGEDPGDLLEGWGERVLCWHMPHFWGPRGPGIQPFSSIRRGPWKMIYYHHPEPKRVLFHLGRDLGERQDLASQQKEILESLSSDLATHLRETGAALPSVDGQTIPMPDELRP
jgi:arylsulfatase A-like enzyme